MIFLLIVAFVLYGLVVFSYLKIHKSTLFRITVSCLLSLSIISILFTVSLFLRMPFWAYILTLLSLGILLFVRVKKRKLKIEYELNTNKWTGIFLINVFIGSILFWFLSSRWGAWDAWAIWNLHAKFLVYNEEWTNLFTNKIAWTHPDYPLMLPSLIAVFWKSINSISPLVPALISYITFLSILGLIYSSIKTNYSKIFSLIGVIVLIADYNFISKAASQYADTLVALFILLAVILVNASKKQPSSYFHLVGFVSSLSIWIKNEGIIFFLFISVVVLFQNYKNLRNVLYYILGTLPIVFILLYFKIVYAPVNDIAGSLNSTAFDKVFVLDRYFIICQHLIEVIIKQFPLIIMAIVMLTIYFKREFLWITFVLVATLSCYLFVYVITPNEINWHLETSLSRLIHQIYPVFVYLCLLTIYKNLEAKRLVFKNEF